MRSNFSIAPKSCSHAKPSSWVNKSQTEHCSTVNPLKLLPSIICLSMIAACGSDTDSVTLGNGLQPQVAESNTADTDSTPDESTAEQMPTAFLGDAPVVEDADTDDNDNSEQTADSEAPPSTGIGGVSQSQQQPLNDASQTDTLPAGAEANPADTDDSIDLSNDILIPPDAPILTVSALPGELVFTWDLPVTDDQLENISYEIDQYDSTRRESINVVRGIEPSVTSFRFPITPHTFQWESTEFILGICTDNDCLRSFNTPVADLQLESINQVQGTTGDEFDLFGSSLAVAANGRVLVAGKPGHDADPDSVAETDNEAADAIFDAGAAELFFEVENEWFAAAVLDVANPSFNSQLGFAVASDGSGDTVVIGAPSNSSDRDLAGAAYVFTRLGETWVRSATLAPGQARSFARFGHSVAISDDGTVIAVGAPGDSNSTIDPFTPIESATDAGSVTLFRFDPSSSSWSLSDYVRSPSIASGQQFGQTVKLNADANTLVVAAPGELAADELAMPGVVHIFDINDAGVFSRQQLVQLATSQQDPTLGGFGNAVALSADGETLLATCLNRPETDGEFTTQLNKPQTEVVVYDLTNDTESGLDTFIEQQRLIPAGEHGFDTTLSVALTAEGNKIAAGLLNPSSGSNSVTVFQRSELSGDLSPEVARWQLINSLEQPDDAVNFGTSVEFSTDGSRLFIGADGGADGGTVYIY